MTSHILPGSVIGILGGGQLGRMLAIAARRMGYRVHCLDPQEGCPAAAVCDRHVRAEFSDLERVAEFARGVDVITLEFENVAAAAALAASHIRPVRPQPSILEICQDRAREKAFLAARGFPCARHAIVRSQEELARALREIGTPAILKTTGCGYDGKGQQTLADPGDAAAAWAAHSAPPGILEEKIAFAAELSVIVARTPPGRMAAFPCVENIHRDHILDTTIAPARLPGEVRQAAEDLARAIAEALGLEGLLAVEMFLCKDGRLVVNELAPRPHNSGHFSFDACVTSQFEQAVRAACHLPLGSTEMLSPSVMWNLLGHLWTEGDPDWPAILAEPRAKLHLYGKTAARPGRKMGHVTILEDIPAALDTLDRLRLHLRDEELRGRKAPQSSSNPPPTPDTGAPPTL